MKFLLYYFFLGQNVRYHFIAAAPDSNRDHGMSTADLCFAAFVLTNTVFSLSGNGSHHSEPSFRAAHPHQRQFAADRPATSLVKATVPLKPSI
jgi:hypothetical protein